ncbi:flagellar protein FliT [Bacillus testis]|uniref:flagellar protein FliT n=1 Tax=Bacillus testis TaxID=1622072 RepID=UPI00067EF104|nr:flagellar protein FliT [Bacillus testis]
MRASLKECYRLTAELRMLTHIPQSDLTDEQYDEISRLLDRRQKVLDDIFPPFTDDEMKIGGVVVSINKEIDMKLVEIKQQLASQIRSVKKQGNSTKKYLGYFQGDAGSYFYDKRN